MKTYREWMFENYDNCFDDIHPSVAPLLGYQLDKFYAEALWENPDELLALTPKLQGLKYEKLKERERVLLRSAVLYTKYIQMCLEDNQLKN
ncbi:hypothetical protein [Trichormus variabilis]|uniref:Uncharacterized protein n=1 Tax=Trichormus variabilis SAG 1403-4b TaxID=447716 RepID=A0A3S1BWL6_ANAVA|nr:hypothetical protein [Trichormus variabilis]MBD2629666.1 hypothetical protein [Trichormus variabilis FACHB-164]RUS92916.1 hypothetical protein DSM107003_46630 [Trichormus variabilis SAG 1403-4b]